MSADKKSDFESLLASELLEATRKNIREAEKSLTDVVSFCESGEKLPKESRWLMEKIRRDAKRYDMEADDIIKEANQHGYALAVLSKNPVKQKLHERLAMGWIEEIHGVKDLEQPGHLFLQEDGSLESTQSDIKPINFTWQYGGVTFYAAHMYTKEAGGGQGSRRGELQRFIENANKRANSYREDDIFLLALCDGPYYVKRPRNFLGTMQGSCDKERVWALPTWQLEDWLREEFGEPESSE